MLYFKKLIVKPIWLVPYGECLCNGHHGYKHEAEPSDVSYLYMGKKHKRWCSRNVANDEVGRNPQDDAFCRVTHPLTWKKPVFLTDWNYYVSWSFFRLQCSLLQIQQQVWKSRDSSGDF